MLAGIGPVWQALLGTLLTWGLTAAGAALVFVFQGGEVRRERDDTIVYCIVYWVLSLLYYTFITPCVRMRSRGRVFGLWVSLFVCLFVCPPICGLYAR